jgi:predicted house-cleaning NTP pyrophosphatase (Maf/HAM1 superfamily)
MILPHIAQLNTKRIVLASGSPRRRELLKVLGLNKFEVCNTFTCSALLFNICIPMLTAVSQAQQEVNKHVLFCTASRTHYVYFLMLCICFPVQIIVSTFEEDLPKHHFDNAADYAIETARHKAMDVARMGAAQTDKPPVDLIISADTVRTTCSGFQGLDQQSSRWCDT